MPAQFIDAPPQDVVIPVGVLFHNLQATYSALTPNAHEKRLSRNELQMTIKLKSAMTL